MLAYRLEPSGTTFTTPLVATIRVEGDALGDGGSATLASRGTLEWLAIVDVRAIEPGVAEVDVEVSHFSALELWSPLAGYLSAGSEARSFVTMTVLSPASGAMFALEEPVPTEVELVRAVGLDLAYVTTDEETGDPLELTVVRSMPGEWTLTHPTTFNYDALGDSPEGHPSRTLMEDTTSEPFTPRCGSTAGPGSTWPYITVELILQETRTPFEGLLPGDPGTPQLVTRREWHQEREPRRVECVTTPVTEPCADLIGSWSASCSFTARPNACGYGDFTDTLNLTIEPDGTVTLEQPSTMDMNTGTATGACHLETMSADGRESYSLECDGAMRTCTGVNEYKNVMMCCVTNDVSCTLSEGGAMGTPVPFCSLPVTVAMEARMTFHQATVVFDESAMSCTAEAPQMTFPGGIFNARVSDSGVRSMTVIAGATRWAIHDVSPGTFASADMATDLPDATEVRMGIMLSGGTTATHVLVFRFDGTDFTLLGVESL